MINMSEMKSQQNVSEQIANPKFLSLIEKSAISAFESSLSSSGGQDWSIKSNFQLTEAEFSEMCLFTICSHLFKIRVAIQYSYSVELAQTFGQSSIKNQVESEEIIQEAIPEFGNILSGLIKRDIGECIRFSGMSTPSNLSALCMQYLINSGAQQSLTFAACLDDNDLIALSVYTETYADVDSTMVFEEKSEDSVSDGEIEFF